MSKECDDCGADGEALLCVCKPKETSVPKKPKRNDVVAANGVGSRGGVLSKGSKGQHQSARVDAVKSPSEAPQSQSKPGGLVITTPLTTAFSGAVIAGAARMRVMCCRCRKVHYHDERLNEWGKPIGMKWMAGRQSWCPTGCGYHVTVPRPIDEYPELEA